MSTSVLEERVKFAREIPPEVNACLQEAVACADDYERAKSLLYKARDMQPEQLEVYVALYKFCFYRGYLEEAEKITLQALKQASSNGGFSENWQDLDRNSADWTVSEGPQRLYLYSLKALSFIRLRRGMHDDARNILAKLQQLDVQDLVGGSVIMSLAEAI